MQHMNLEIRAYRPADLGDMVRIWNEVVEDGVAFPQEDLLTPETGAEFFAAQTESAVAADRETGRIYGLYILHPNNVGRCGHICNASYAVSRAAGGCTSASSWCVPAWRRARASASGSCSSTPWWPPTSMRGTSMNGWALCRWVSSPAASG